MPASQLTQAIDAVVEALADRGIPATSDARNTSTSGYAWVTVHDITDTLGGALRVRAAVYLIAGDRGGRVHLEELGRLLDRTATVLTFDEPAQMVTVTPPGNAPAPLPALRIITTTE